MNQKLDNSRLLIYSHDSFGLGHLRRCQTIAHALVDAYKGLSVLILTGSPIIGQFDFKARVDFVRIPGIIKLHNGSYTSLGLHIDLEDTLALRESIIHHTARVFAPDIFLVDKEPTGLQGEVLSTLKMLKNTKTHTILGLREVMDAPDLLEQEWNRKDVWPILDSLYDEIWVYGPKAMGSPFHGIKIADKLQHKNYYTGYLKRHLAENINTETISLPPQPFTLVTPGGGGDGIDLIDWVLRAYESTTMPHHALIVLGPFMEVADRNLFLQRAEKLHQVTMITFSSNLEYLLTQSSAVVAMGGYNTFCEILSFDKPALIIPRSKPRKEQLIRATKAESLGLVSMLNPENGRETKDMVEAMQQLVDQSLPSDAPDTLRLNGLEKIAQRISVITSLKQEAGGPRLFFYVQYLLGIGHLRRAALLVKSMVNQGLDVHVIAGGVPVKQIDFGDATVHYLQPVKSADANFSRLVNADGSDFTEAHEQARREQLLNLAREIQPDIILTETYPFGRRKMRFELNPLLQWAELQSPRPLVVSSIRDILQRRKEKREQESIQLIQQHYDHVLVHGDADFTALETSFPPAKGINGKIAYTGYVCPETPFFPPKREGIIVSIGGGSIGYETLATALKLYQSGYEADSNWAFMTGPNMDPEKIAFMESQADDRLTVLRMSTNFVERLAAAKVSVSLGGYNTTMDILKTSVPAVIIPFEGEEESEQLERSQMLADAGRIQMLRFKDLTTETLKQTMEAAKKQQPTHIAINVDGADNSALLLHQWWNDRD